MTFGSLFTGIGGFDLGLERAGMECKWQVENDPFAIKVLEKHWPDVKRYEDIKNVKNPEPVDVICGGFPCQPFSRAGKQGGAKDDRNLWPEMYRIIKQARPPWVICENVVDIEYMVLDQVLFDLETEGFAARAFNIPAGALQSNHARERIWIVAYNERTGTKLEEHPGSRQVWEGAENPQRKMVSRRNRQACSEGVKPNYVLFNGETFQYDGQVEPLFLGGTHGIPSRLDRRRTLGNAVLPQIPELLGKVIIKTHNKQINRTQKAAPVI